MRGRAPGRAGAGLQAGPREGFSGKVAVCLHNPNFPGGALPRNHSPDSSSKKLKSVWNLDGGMQKRIIISGGHFHVFDKYLLGIPYLRRYWSVTCRSNSF